MKRRSTTSGEGAIVKFRRTSTLVATAAAVALVVPASIPMRAQAQPIDGQPGDRAAIGLGNMFYPFSPAPGLQASFPHLALIDQVNRTGQRTPEVWLSFSQGPDAVTNTVPSGVLVSRDGGATYTDRRDDSGVETLAMMRRSNGEYIAPKFIPEWTDRGPAVITKVSADRGATWQERRAVVTPPPGKTFASTGFDRGIRVHKNIMELPDGRLIVGAYGKFTEDQRWSAMLITSTDGGSSWSVWGVINGDNSVGASEPSFSRTVDGRLIAVLRGSPESAGLMQAYSSDDGRTWTTPTRLQAPTPTVNGAVEPSVVLQPNGQLVLAYGRPGNHALVSASGNGDDWGNYQLLQNNVPPRNAEPTWGSSANMTMVPLDGNRSLVAGDTCAPWGCQPYNETYAIWARQIDAVGPGTGKLDLTTMLAEGRARITADVLTDPLFPQTSAAGAVDGSSDKHATARIRPGSSVVVELDQVYRLNKLGLLMAPGVKQSANIQLSTDGRAWGKPEVKLRDRVDSALAYTEIQPTEAKFIKIGPDGDAPLDAVTELEAYAADTDTFENDPVNAPPRGWVRNSLAQVVDTAPQTGTPRTAGFGSRRALRLLDFATDDIATAQRAFPARQQVSIDYQMMGVNRQTGTIVTVKGTDASGRSVDAYHFLIDPISREIRQYDGRAWNSLGQLPAPINPNVWAAVQITADTAGGTLKIGDTSFTTRPPTGAPTALNALAFSSAGTAPKGSSFYFDNVRIR
ncbi:hypothetical protein CGZ98_13685 [Enemella evansiae]|nr:hypothetical protein CGZ98_13685 [Enemella evansiae]